MSFNDINKEKSIDEFTLEITEKTKLFFKTFSELTKDNLDTYLDCINLLDVWNTEEEKEFLWNSFYKYNIDGKVIEPSVLKGLNEILNKNDNNINSIIEIDERNENYSADDFTIIKISYNKKRSSSIIKSSINSSLFQLDFDSENIIQKKDMNNIKNFIESNDIKMLKQIKNIMLIVNFNYFSKDNNKHPMIKISQVLDIFKQYPSLNISINTIINYLTLISENSSVKKENFNINNDLYKLSLTLIDNKIKKYEKESIYKYNDELNGNSYNNISQLLL